LQALEPTARAAFRDDLSAIVREAGALAAGKFGGAFRHWTKGESSPVTEVDIAVDDFLRERLPRLAPGGWLSEETEDDSARLGASRVWIVDPIDGTRAFVSGRTDWAVSVALVEDGRPVAAALYSPLEDGLYLALAGEGASRDGAPIAVNEGANLAQARVAGPKPMIERLAKSEPAIVAEPKVFSLALRIARIAAGRLDVAFASGNSHDWDLAGADLLVHEAGGALTTFTGEPVIYNRAEARHGALVAAGRARHDRVLGIIGDRRS
jgi:myo-inositol-1(or 4)-monophosphatase